MAQYHCLSLVEREELSRMLDALFHLGPAARRLLEYPGLSHAPTYSDVTTSRTMVETLEQYR
jgi:hypothetical protein